MSDKYIDFFETIAKYNSFAIVSHLSPDGDNLGSIIALYNYLISLDKVVYPVELDNIPHRLKFITSGIPFTNNNKLDVDVLIAVDCGDRKRLGDIDYIFNQSKEVIKIDHHLSDENYGTINIVDSNISSTCELISNILMYDSKNLLSKEIATPLLLGILTDTGRFLYERADCNTFKTSSKLMELGADKNYLMKKLFQSDKLAALKAITEINNDAEFYYDNSLVITSVTKKFLKDRNLEMADVENVINYYRDAEDVEVSCMIKEKDTNIFKISFRSKNYVDVNEIASTFNGGGHKFASGCVIEGNLNKVKDIIIERFKNTQWI